MRTLRHFKNHVTRLDILFYLFLFLWMLIELTIHRPDSIVNDWMGWRQADTQAIALNFLKPGANLFMPRIDWGGNGPGYVESELQLYPAIISLIMRITGESELPGQCLSLLFISISAIVIRLLLEKPFGSVSATLAAMTFLSMRTPAYLAMSVQPDALCFLLYLLAIYFFVRFVDSRNFRLFYFSMIFTVLAGLVKPTALHVGIFQFLFLLFKDRNALKIKRIWLGWISVPAIIAMHLYHGNQIFQQYGNTFGVLFNGDSKMPQLHNLLTPGKYFDILKTSLTWGVGTLGILAAIVVTVRRQVSAAEWALFISNAIILCTAMRYTTEAWLGAHYHIFSSLLGVWLIAHAAAIINKSHLSRNLKTTLALLFVLTLAGQYAFCTRERDQGSQNVAILSIGKALRSLVETDELIIVRSGAEATTGDTWGNRVNNFEDPRIFYLAGTRGWVVPSDRIGIHEVSLYRDQGADFYVETYDAARDNRCIGPPLVQETSEFKQWLEANTQVLLNTACGRIYKFNKNNR